MPQRINDLTGRKFGRLTVVERVPPPREKRHARVHWRCVCECGNEKITSTDCLRYSSTQSCGCLHRETAKAKAVKAYERTRLRDHSEYVPPRRHSLYPYKLTLEQHRRLWDATNGHCYSCGVRAHLSVDHDHETGKVRGLLCHDCNAAEGFLKTVKRARQLADYMEEHRHTPEYGASLMAPIFGEDCK